MLEPYVDRLDNSGSILPLTANTMTRMVQISPGVAFAALVLSPEWSAIATGGFRTTPAQVNNFAAAADSATSSAMNATPDIKQFDLL